MAERNVFVYDVRKLEEPEQKRESALKYMTRKVACMTDGKGECREREPFLFIFFRSERSKGKEE